MAAAVYGTMRKGRASAGAASAAMSAVAAAVSSGAGEAQAQAVGEAASKAYAAAIKAGYPPKAAAEAASAAGRLVASGVSAAKASQSAKGGQCCIPPCSAEGLARGGGGNGCLACDEGSDLWQVAEGGCRQQLPRVRRLLLARQSLRECL
jgi:hypothetical protein